MTAETLYYVHREVLPTALELLPGKMDSPEARAMILAIGLQESKFKYRIQQPNGPAHGFWQFEKGGGVRGVLTNGATAPLIFPVLQVLAYPANEAECYVAISHNDVLATCFARLLLWSVPGALPRQNEPSKGWAQYLKGWRPGKPHPQTWDANFAEAWRTVTEE